MLDVISIIITVIVTILVILLTVIGVEIFRTLRQFQKTLIKLDNILTDFNIVSNSVATPIVKLSTFVQGMQEGSTVINLLAKVAEKLFTAKKDDSK